MVAGVDGWAFAGSMPDWPVPYVSEQAPTFDDVAAASARK
jgi:hypothetical protein